MTLRFAISFALTADIALNAGAAVFGPEHFTLVPMPIGQFGALVAAGIVVHEIVGIVTTTARAAHRGWRRFRSRRQASVTPRRGDSVLS